MSLKLFYNFLARYQGLIGYFLNHLVLNKKNETGFSSKRLKVVNEKFVNDRIRLICLELTLKYFIVVKTLFLPLVLTNNEKKIKKTLLAF